MPASSKTCKLVKCASTCRYLPVYRGSQTSQNCTPSVAASPGMNMVRSKISCTVAVDVSARDGDAGCQACLLSYEEGLGELTATTHTSSMLIGLRAACQEHGVPPTCSNHARDTRGRFPTASGLWAAVGGFLPPVLHMKDLFSSAFDDVVEGLRAVACHLDVGSARFH